MKVHGIAGVLIIPGDVFPSEAQEGGEADVEAGGRVLGQRGKYLSSDNGLAGGVVGARGTRDEG